MLPIAHPDPAGLSWCLHLQGADGHAGWDWYHYDLVHAQARQAIEADPALPDFARALLLGADESPRMIAGADVVAGVLPAYARTGDAAEFSVTTWHFAMTPTRLVTGRRSATRTLVHIWEQVQRGAHPASPAALVHLCIASFAREVRGHLAGLAADLDPIEDVLIDPRNTPRLADLAAQLGSARREATQLKRVLTPLARALEEDETEDLPTWALPADHDPGLRLLRGALDDIAALYDRARSLQDELTARLAEETNRRLYVVSVVTTVLLPATFVTGFFGMNTGGLLWAGEEIRHGTLYAGVLCALAVACTLGLLRWRRLL